MQLIAFKIFFQILLLSLIFGCGKKITESSVPNKSPASHQGRSPALTLQVNEAVSPVKMFKIPNDSWFKLPAHLTAAKGNAVGKKITIFYNLTSNGDYEFQCTYHSARHDTVLSFEKCETMQGEQIVSNSDEIQQMQFPMDEGSFVKLELTNPSGDGMKIDSFYTVKWK